MSHKFLYIQFGQENKYITHTNITLKKKIKTKFSSENENSIKLIQMIEKGLVEYNLFPQVPHAENLGILFFKKEKSTKFSSSEIHLQLVEVSVFQN